MELCSGAYEEVLAWRLEFYTEEMPARKCLHEGSSAEWPSPKRMEVPVQTTASTEMPARRSLRRVVCAEVFARRCLRTNLFGVDACMEVVL